MVELSAAQSSQQMRCPGVPNELRKSIETRR
jgi:hypothetical protein